MGEGFHVVEAGQGNVADGALSTAAYHGVGAAFADEAVGLAHGVCAGGTGRHYRQVRALAVILDGHVGRADVGNHHGDKVGRHTAGAFFHQFGVLGVEGLDAADTRTYGAADAHGLDVGANLQAAVGHGLMGGSKGKEGVHVIAAHGAFVKVVVLGVEIFHLGSHVDGESVAVGCSNRGYSATAFNQSVPQGVDVVA